MENLSQDLGDVGGSQDLGDMGPEVSRTVDTRHIHHSQDVDDVHVTVDERRKRVVTVRRRTAVRAEVPAGAEGEEPEDVNPAAPPFQREIEEKESRLKETEEMLEREEEELVQKEEELEEEETQLESIAHELDEKAEALEQKEDALEQKEEALEQQVEAVEAEEQHLETVAERVRQREAEVARKERELAAKEAQLRQQGLQAPPWHEPVLAEEGQPTTTSKDLEQQQPVGMCYKL
eukprot:jgi/Chlat1/5680/Chrsp37S05485